MRSDTLWGYYHTITHKIKHIMKNEVKHFIKFLKEQHMLIPIMLMMKDNEITFENLHKLAEKCAMTCSSGDFPTVGYYMDVVENQMPPVIMNHHKESLDQLWMNYSLDKDLQLIPDPTPSKPNRSQMKQKFIDFLKENNLLIPYCVELAMKPSYSAYNFTGNTLSNVCKRTGKLNWILHAFWFNQTNRSGDYREMWNVADDKWEIICNSQ